jgi:xanthine dehydrogenase YagS FAD-binding subunit
VREAAEHLAQPGSVLHAGGTDLLCCLRDRVFSAEKVVSIGRLKHLSGFSDTAEGGLRIGALARITEVAENPSVIARYTALAQGAAEVASPQLRNQGTIGGNICQKPRCWYYRGDFHCLRKGGGRCFAFNGENRYHCILGGKKCHIVHPSDTAPALVAFEATARVVGPGGIRLVPLEKFHVSPSEDPRRETVLEAGEIVTEIILPPQVKWLRSSYRKVRARRAWDFALAGVALAVQLAGDRVVRARVVLSGAAPFPWRSREAEDEITGKRIDPETAGKAAAAAMEKAKPLSQNGYKIRLFLGLIESELLALAKAS